VLLQTEDLDDKNLKATVMVEEIKSLKTEMDGEVKALKIGWG
jgi:hypothetical protein